MSALPAPAAHVVLIKPGSMGDVIHAVPVVEAMRAARPAWKVTWIVDDRWAPLLDGLPGVDKHLFPRNRFRGADGWLRALRWMCGLKSLEADCVVDLQGLFRSGVMAFSIRCRDVIGLSDAREGSRWIQKKTARVDSGEHAVHRYRRALPLLGIPVPEKPVWKFKLPPLPQALTGHAYAVLHPTARGAGKSLDAECVETFARTFHEAGGPRLVLVGQGDGSAPGGVLDLRNRTSLPELGAVLSGACFVVSVDSGPMHWAVALGRPTLSIHTWSDPRKVGPYAEDCWIWQGGEIRPQRLGGPLPRAKPFTPRDADLVARFAAGQSNSAI